MKKLLFVAAAFACGSLLALESANVVGYAQSQLDTDYGAVMTSSQFVDVGTTDGSISLSALTPIAAEGIDTAYSIAIQVLDSAGLTTDQDYTWNGTSWENTNDGSDVSDVKFSKGQGLWVYSFVGEKVGFQSSGQVLTEDVYAPLDLEYGATAVGNPFPVEVALADIMPMAAEGIDTAYSVAIQVLDSAGLTTDQDYTWNGTSWENTNDGSDVSDVKFAPGQGLWVYSFVGEEVNLFIPAPEL